MWWYLKVDACFAVVAAGGGRTAAGARLTRWQQPGGSNRVMSRQRHEGLAVGCAAGGLQPILQVTHGTGLAHAQGLLHAARDRLRWLGSCSCSSAVGCSVWATRRRLLANCGDRLPYPWTQVQGARCVCGNSTKWHVQVGKIFVITRCSHRPTSRVACDCVHHAGHPCGLWTAFQGCCYCCRCCC
jgi:hypothetical protein